MTTATEHEVSFTHAAPAGALCAGCGCGCQGETVIVETTPGPLGGVLITYRHLSAAECSRARARSDAFWRET